MVGAAMAQKALGLFDKENLVISTEKNRFTGNRKEWNGQECLASVPQKLSMWFEVALLLFEMSQKHNWNIVKI